MSAVFKVVKQLHDLCKDPANRPYIARRGLLPGLRGFLEHLDLQVVMCAAEAIKFLASHPDNVLLIRKEPSMLPTLLKLFRNYCDADSSTMPEQFAIANHCAETLVYVKEHLNFPEIMEHAQKHNLPCYVELMNADVIGSPTSKRAVDAKLSELRDRNREYAESVNEGEKRITVILNPMTELSNARRRIIEHVLLGTRGVLSFSWIGKKLSVFSMLIPSKLVKTLRVRCDVDFHIESEEEHVQGLHLDAPRVEANKENNSPQYLTAQQVETAERKTRAANTRAVLTARGDDSIAARAARLRVQQESGNSQDTQQSSAASSSFLSRFKIW